MACTWDELHVMLYFLAYKKNKCGVGVFNDTHVDKASVIVSLLVTMSMVMAVITTCKTREIIFNTFMWYQHILY